MDDLIRNSTFYCSCRNEVIRNYPKNSDRIKYILSSFIERENNFHIDGVPFAYLFHKSKVRYTRYLKLPDIIGFIVIPQMYEKAQVNLVTILFTQLSPKSFLLLVNVSYALYNNKRK